MPQKNNFFDKLKFFKVPLGTFIIANTISVKFRVNGNAWVSAYYDKYTLTVVFVQKKTKIKKKYTFLNMK